MHAATASRVLPQCWPDLEHTLACRSRIPNDFLTQPAKSRDSPRRYVSLICDANYRGFRAYPRTVCLRALCIPHRVWNSLRCLGSKVFLPPLLEWVSAWVLVALRSHWFGSLAPMLRAQDRSRRPTEAGLRFTVQQLPGEQVHEFPSESLARSGILGLYHRWKKSRAIRLDDYPRMQGRANRYAGDERHGLCVQRSLAGARSAAIVRDEPGDDRLSGRPIGAAAGHALQTPDVNGGLPERNLGFPHPVSYRQPETPGPEYLR